MSGDAHSQVTSGNGTGKCRFEAGADSERALPWRALEGARTALGHTRLSCSRPLQAQGEGMGWLNS